MEISLEAIISLIGLFTTGSGIGIFFTWRYAKKKAKAEATQAEAEAEKARAEAEQARAEALKQQQEYYRNLIDDLAKDREDRKGQNDELRRERDHYKHERNELRDEVGKLRDEVAKVRSEGQERELVILRKFERVSRKVDAMRPFLCSDLRCPNRQRVAISEDGESEMPSQTDEQHDIEPLNED